MTTALDAALAYAGRGWPVFPCKPGEKVPDTVHGVLDATTDEAQIRAWWTEYPDRNVAIATGDPGPDIVDIDVKPDGDGYGAFADLAGARLAGDPIAYVRTPSGGMHAYYHGSKQRNGTLRGKHIDFRGSGGYVLAPPSAVSGHTYSVLTEQEPDGPAYADWRAIRSYLEPPPAFQQPPPAARHAGTASTDDRAGDDFAARTSWEDILTPHDWRVIRQIGGIRYWCRPGKTGLFTSATTRDDGGLYVFSTSTPFDPEVPYTKFGAYAVLEHGNDYKAAAAALRAAGFGTPLPAVTGPAAVAEPSENEQEAIAGRYNPVNWHEAWSGQPEETEWLVDGFLEAGTVNALFAKPGTGKSLLALDVSRELARRGITVVYIDDENRVADLVERLRDMDCKPDELDRLLVYSFAGLPALDTAAGGMHLKAIAMTRKARLVILDTTSRMVAGKENDADTFLQLYRCSLVGLKSLGITVLRLDHPGKDMAKGQRGSSAKEGDVDTIWRLEPVSGITYRLEREKSRSGHGETVFTLQRRSEPLRHQWEISGADDQMVRQIAALGLPRTAGRDTIKKALNEAGVASPGNVALSAAIRTWKLTLLSVLSPQDRPPDQDRYESVRDITEPIHETAAQTCPGQGQDRLDSSGVVPAGGPVLSPTTKGGDRSGAPVPDWPPGSVGEGARS